MERHQVDACKHFACCVIVEWLGNDSHQVIGSKACLPVMNFEFSSCGRLPSAATHSGVDPKH
jgi:hypothetical protein